MYTHVYTNVERGRRIYRTSLNNRHIYGMLPNRCVLDSLSLSLALSLALSQPLYACVFVNKHNAMLAFVSGALNRFDGGVLVCVILCVRIFRDSSRRRIGVFSPFRLHPSRSRSASHISRRSLSRARYFQWYTDWQQQRVNCCCSMGSDRRPQPLCSMCANTLLYTRMTHVLYVSECGGNINKYAHAMSV